MPALTVRAAREADLPVVHEILDDAARWLVDQGIEQWPARYPREETVVACVQGRLWLGEKQRRVVATMRTASSDTDVWGEDTGDALYVHALAVRRVPLAEGSGAEMVRWALRSASNDRLGRLRLDCAAGNRKLRQYYEAMGFRHVDDITQTSGELTWRTSRLERPVPWKR